MISSATDWVNISRSFSGLSRTTAFRSRSAIVTTSGRWRGRSSFNDESSSLDPLRLDCVEGLERGVEMFRATLWWQKGLDAPAKNEQPGIVAGARSRRHQ